jgi:ABC-type glycerol-3-phosphate transport system substrate-binding protein
MPSNVRRGNIAFTVAYSMAAASEHKQAAWELLSYLTGRDWMQVWTSGGVALPSRDDVPVLPGRVAFIGEAPISTVWGFPPGSISPTTSCGRCSAGPRRRAEMLAAIEAAARAVLGQG